MPFNDTTGVKKLEKSVAVVVFVLVVVVVVVVVVLYAIYTYNGIQRVRQLALGCESN